MTPIPVAVRSEVLANTDTSLSSVPTSISRQIVILPSSPSVTVKGGPVGNPTRTAAVSVNYLI